MSGKAVASRDSAQVDPAVEVRDNDSYKGVFATTDIASGSVIFQLRGTISPRPSKYTIQIDNERHLGAPAAIKANDKLDYCWKYLNHSCEPNGFINVNDLTFLALSNIAAGEEITFNYLTTESAMDVPFNCRCGSKNCFGLIRGRDFLTEEELDQLSSAIGKTIK
jgi:hypothetical protein